jgi:hypothetical protein
MELVADSGGGEAAQGDFKDAATGVVVLNPQGWSRTAPIDGADVTWIDPSSDTALISAKVLRAEEEGQAFKALWEAQKVSVKAKSTFIDLGEEKLTFARGDAVRLKYSFHEGRYVRLAELLLAYNKTSKVGVRIEAGAAENEAEAVHKQLQAVFAKLDIPNATAPADQAGAPGAPKTATPAPAPGAAVQPAPPAPKPPERPANLPPGVPFGKSAINPD